MNRKRSRHTREFLRLLIILALPGLACGVLDRVEELPDEAPAIIEEALEQQPAVDSGADEPQAPAVDDAAPVTEDEDARAPISGALRPGGIVDAVRVTVTSENLDSGDTTVSTAAFVEPDSYLLADDTMDAIVAGGKSYARNEGGSYEETFDMSFIVGGLVTNLIDPWSTEAGLVMVTFSETEGEPELLGEETVRGVTTLVYEYAIPLPESVSADPILYRIWIGADDELAYRQEIEHPVERTLSRIEFEYDGVEILAPE